MSVTWQNMHIAHASIDTIWYYSIPYVRSTSSPACASQLENRIPMNGSIISIKLARTPLHPSSSKRGQLVTEHSHIPHSLPILFQVYSHDIPMIFPWTYTVFWPWQTWKNHDLQTSLPTQGTPWPLPSGRWPARKVGTRWRSQWCLGRARLWRFCSYR